MEGILIALHIVICILMVLIILLQTGKGADVGAAFGGGSSQTLFGSSGPVGFLNKLTTAIATLFMVTSLVLAFMASRPATKTMVDDIPQQEAPAKPVQ